MNPQEAFWNWFTRHEAELFDFERDRERIFDELLNELQKVDPDLCFEFGPRGTRREIVVSAGGMQRAFGAVVSLVSAAPTFNRWKVTAFRPRRPLNILEFRGKRIDPIDVHFSLLNNGRKIGIYLFIPGFRDDDTDLKQIGYLLLDEALGEYDVEMGLGLIKICFHRKRAQMGSYRLAHLPSRFDRLASQLELRSTKLS